ncbi:MAG: N-6 DNA methylase [Firmicutes bacterium]|nr:N-6 DNA methylase [Bacillota bacterium]
MLNQTNIELIYEVIDESSMIFFETINTTYLAGIVFTCENILSQEILQDINEDAKLKLFALIHKIYSIDFKKEEVRKALQLSILKGLKHSNRNNQDITPDTIGIFIAYLVDKLYHNQTLKLIFDPLIGTGNLLTCIGNHIEAEVELIGVEHNEESYKLARALFDMMDYKDNLFFQDTLTFNNIASDLIVTDFPTLDKINEPYFPYEVIKHHYHNLRNDGYFIGIIPNDFFTVSGSVAFKESIIDMWKVLGLIQLPISMFKGIGKSVLILQKCTKEELKNDVVLLAEIPSFEDQEGVQIAIKKINKWFEERT